MYRTDCKISKNPAELSQTANSVTSPADLTAPTDVKTWEDIQVRHEDALQYLTENPASYEQLVAKLDALPQLQNLFDEQKLLYFKACAEYDSSRLATNMLPLSGK
jgi:hypothetical protein